MIDEAVDEMLAANIIGRAKPLWSFHVVMVDKKHGSKRFFVDCRKLNNITKRNIHS